MKHRGNRPRRRDDERGIGHKRSDSSSAHSRVSGNPAKKKMATSAYVRHPAKTGSPPPRGRAEASVVQRVQEKPAPQLPTQVQTVTVSGDESNMRVDRFLEA